MLEATPTSDSDVPVGFHSRVPNGAGADGSAQECRVGTRRPNTARKAGPCLLSFAGTRVRRESGR
jgi:hypothetical protein